MSSQDSLLLSGEGKVPLKNTTQTYVTQRTEHPLGQPKAKPLLSWTDTVTLAVSLTGFILAVATVLLPVLAMWLGQTNQLILVGFLVAIMGSCSQIQLRHLFFLIEARFGSSTLQNYQALLINDAWAQRITLLPQVVLLTLFILPLGLSAGYKLFVGGSTSSHMGSTAGLFGLTAEPGKQLVGDGLSLLSNIYLPFWLSPSFPGTYGFNMYVASNETTALLDGPLPEYVQQLQSTINLGESVMLTARVNATVAKLSALSPQQRSSDGFWEETYADYQGNLSYEDDLEIGGYSAMLSGTGTSWDPGWNANYSQIFTALWNTTQNETFESTAQRYDITRRLCTGVWNITSTSILLQNASDLQDSKDALISIDQTLVQQNPLGIAVWFGSFLGEYDWHNWKAFKTEVGHNHTASMGPGLVASMVWARQVSYNGWERRAFDQGWAAVNHYEKIQTEIITLKNVPTLKRGAGLLFILSLHPLLTMAAIVGKFALYSVPIGEGFGLISLLAGIREEDLGVLRGSALSGKLRRELRLHFYVENSKVSSVQDRIVVGLGQSRNHGKIKRRAVYG
jgi:hypothetical protein